MSNTVVKSKKAVVKIKTTRKTATAKAKPVKPVPVSIIKEGELKNVAVADIDFSPLNYRKFYSEAALNDFAVELAIHGIISPLTLRKMPSGRYELVAGERRLRAAGIAKLKEVPAVIKDLTDAEVTEIQLAENLQREDPHPMHEAQAIGQMQRIYKSIDEIAGRLGKSKKFVYSRIKFLDLIEPIQEMFVADAINIQGAFDIAALSAQSQQEFFDYSCADWKDEEDFKISNLRYALSRFKYDLKSAPFDTKDKKLVAEMGACTNCPFNSATLKTLFPEIAAQANCNKKDCYQAKCDNHFKQLFKMAFKEYLPDAIIFGWGLTEALQKLTDSITETDSLPRFEKNEVTVIAAPEMPDKSDYTNEPYGHDEEEDEEYNDEEHFSEAEEVEMFDETGYNAALHEYEADLEEYNGLIANGGLLKGLLVTSTKVELVMFSPAAPKSSSNNNNNVASATAKEVQEAIKAGKATVQLLQGEIDRINNREQRAKELDNEKIQLNIHAAFIEGISGIEKVTALTAADLVAARLLVYQSLDWSARNKVTSVLFGERAKRENGQELSFYELLQNLTELEYSYLVRMAIGCKSEGKLPNNDTGEMIRKVAEGAGVDIAHIQREQQDKADKRSDKLEERTNDLQLKIKRLDSIK